MDLPRASAPTPKTSAIPRLSRLPLPRPSSSLDTRPQSPLPVSEQPLSVARPPPRSSIGRQSLHATVRGRPSLLPPPTPRTALPPAKAKATTKQSVQPGKLTASTTRPLAKQPLRHPARQTQSSSIPPTQSLKQFRRGSDQENELHPEESPGPVDGSPEFSTLSVTSPAPSLTDRTLESLSHVPTPSSGRRRSSFFNPHTPMTATRSSSVMGSVPISKLNYGSVRRTALPRPSSPLKSSTKVEKTTATMRPPARRISSLQMTKASATPSRPPLNAKQAASVARLSTPAVKPVISTSRPASAASTSRRASSGFSIPPLPASRPGTAMSASSRTSAIDRPTSSLASRAAPSRTLPLKSSAATSTNGRGTKAMVGQLPLHTKIASATSTSKTASSSAALRAQIAQAKAAAQRQETNKTIHYSTLEEVDSTDEEAAQLGILKNKKQTTILSTRIETARKYGRLNISAMSLKTIPEEVLDMYTPQALEQSSIPWFEAVPVTHLVAADNEFEEIRDEAFPDSDKENDDDEQARGQIFGGVETIDFHGNLLTSLPKGLKRLDMLTSLNLSRNKLDNRAFDVISLVVSLRSLNVSNNELCKEMPESVGNLINLEHLDLSHNRLVLLPPTLGSLVRLQTLDLSHNRFSDLTMDAIAQLTNLTELRASNNALTGSLFPSTVESLDTLEILDVSNNSLASLSFADSLVLPTLTHLDVSRNRLYALPYISHWQSLCNILAEDNSLTEFPPGFTTLHQLRKADFKGNCFRQIDIQVASMPNLESLNMAANPLTDRRLASLGWSSLKAELLRRIDEDEMLAQSWDRSRASVDGTCVDIGSPPTDVAQDDDEMF